MIGMPSCLSVLFDSGWPDAFSMGNDAEFCIFVWEI
jgi:hypothetical protein